MEQDQEHGPRCPRCGTELPHGASFCPHCGARLDESVEPAPVPNDSSPSDSNVISRIGLSMAPAAGRTLDASLGDSLVFGPSLRTLVGLFGLGVVLLGVSIGVAPAGQSPWVIPIGVAFCAAGLWAAQTSLAVGTEGLRYSGPMGSTEIRWDQVSKVRTRHSDWTDYRWVNVTLADGTIFEFGRLGLSDSRDRISEMMEECHSAWHRAAGAQPASDGLGRSARPATVVRDPSVRSALMFGLGAVVLVGLVAGAYMWRIGTFDDLLRGAPGAPDMGHWEGSSPALSFDIGPDGQMENVRLVVDDLPYASCSLWTSTIPVAADHTFASVLGSTPGNLMTFKVEVKGTFYGATASGTYRTRKCPGLLPTDSVVDGKWSAHWQYR